MDSIEIIIYIILGVLFVSYMIYRLIKNYNEKLISGFTQFAATIGFTFEDKPQTPATNGYTSKLFNIGRARNTRFVLSGNKMENSWKIFRYQYTTGYGKSQSTYSFSVFAIKTSNKNFPAFELKKENFFHKMANALGFKDINFEQYPKFSKEYRLTGAKEDESAIRKLFSSDIIYYFENNVNKFNIEAQGNNIIFFTKGHNPKSVQENYDKIRKMVDVFTRR